MIYIVQTASALFTLSTSNLKTTLDPKEGLIGRKFVAVKSIVGDDVFLHVDSIVTIAKSTFTPPKEASHSCPTQSKQS